MKQSQSGFWVTNATWVTQDSKRATYKGSAYIRSGRIEELSRTSIKSRSSGRNSKNIDASGLTAFPGFVQTHVHLCQTLFRNLADGLELLDWLKERIWKFEAAHTSSTLQISAELGIFELLSTGTTTILDMGTIRHTDELFKTALKMGIRANIGKCLMDDAEFCPPYLVESTDSALNEALALHARWNQTKSPLLYASYAPRFALSCTSKLLLAVAKIVESQNAILHTHTSENKKEIELVQSRTGMTNIEYLKSKQLITSRSVLAHGVWLDEREINILKHGQSTITHCPGSNMKLGSGIAKISHLLNRGINVALGADGAACNNRLDLVQEMRLACLLQSPLVSPTALTAQGALDMATRGGAKALGLFNEFGSIETGKSADFSLWNLHCATSLPRSDQSEDLASSLVFSSSSHQNQATFVAGKCVYRNDNKTTLYEKDLSKRVAQARKKILTKAQKIAF